MIHDFIAFDVETPNRDNDSICQIGIVKVTNLKIVERLSLLVRPPENRYDNINICFHGICPEHTESEPEFHEIWPLISSYFINQTLVAHNAGFDITVLEKVANLYDINLSGFAKDVYCTSLLNNRASLPDCCRAYNIELMSHHDGLCDAEACANIFINMQTDGPVYVEKTKKKPLFASKKIDRETLKKELSNADPNNPFYDKRVVITGNHHMDRNDLASILKTMGADINTSISRKTDFVIAGSGAGPSKMGKVRELISEGFHIKIISTEELKKLLSLH